MSNSLRPHGLHHAGLPCPSPSPIYLYINVFIFYIVYKYLYISLVAQMVKNLPAVQETWVRSLGQEDLLENGMVTHSNILAWRIPWTEEPGRLWSWGCNESQMQLSSECIFIYNTCIWRMYKNIQYTPYILKCVYYK